MREAAGEDVTAKDFRTWAGTNLAFLAFCALEKERPTRKSQTQVIKQGAEQLGNTPAVCRKCYIHPVVLNGCLDGILRANPCDIELEEEYPDVWMAERKVIRILRSGARSS